MPVAVRGSAVRASKGSSAPIVSGRTALTASVAAHLLQREVGCLIVVREYARKNGVAFDGEGDFDSVVGDHDAMTRHTPGLPQHDDIAPT